MNKTLIILLVVYLEMVIASFLIHYLVGKKLKGRLEKEHKLEIYNTWDAKEKNKRTISEKIKLKIIYFIPICNLLIATIEIFNMNQCYYKLLGILKKFEKRGY